jgi:hypothetical protein
VLHHDGTVALEATLIAMTPVIDPREVRGAGREGSIDVVKSHLAPDFGSELLLKSRRARPPPSGIPLELDEGDAGDRFQQPPGGEPFTFPGLGGAVIVQGHGGLDAPGEGEQPAVQTVREKFSGVSLREGQVGLKHLVVELNARGTPHHHLARGHALEQLHGVIGVPLTRGLLPTPMVLDATAVGRPARRHVVEPESVEDGRHCLDQVRGPEYVAAQVQDHVVALTVARGLEQPRALFLLGEKVVSEFDLSEVLAVVEAHRWSPSSLVVEHAESIMAWGRRAAITLAHVIDDGP